MRPGLGKKLLLVAGALGLALLVAELFLRGELCRRAGEQEFARVAERFRANPLSVGPKRKPPSVGISAARRARGNEGINQQGFRGPPVAPTKPAGTLRVVCLGGSSVYGTANSTALTTWPARLQQVLAATRPAEVLNGGVPGFQAQQSVERFETVFVPLHCDVAIVCNLFNDVVTSRAERLGLLAGDRAVDPLEGWMPSLLAHSALGMLALSSSLDVGSVWDDDGDPGHADGTSFLRPVPPTIQEREGLRGRTQDARDMDARRPGSWLDRCFFPQDLRAYVATLERFVDAARAAGCEPVLCVEPLAVDPAALDETWATKSDVLQTYFPSAEVFSDVYGRYAAAMHELAARRGVLLFDAQARYERAPGDFFDVVHFTDDGAQAFAEQLARELLASDRIAATH